MSCSGLARTCIQCGRRTPKGQVGEGRNTPRTAGHSDNVLCHSTALPDFHAVACSLLVFFWGCHIPTKSHGEEDGKGRRYTCHKIYSIFSKSLRKPIK